MHTGARRVGDDHIGAAVSGDKLVGENVFHVAGIERRLAVQPIQFGIHLRVLNGFGHILNAHNVARLARHKVGNRPGTGVQVVDQLVAREFGEVTCHLIQFVGLLAVGLVETLRPHFEAQSLHRLVNEVGAGIGHHIEIADRVVALRVVDIEQRSDLGEGGVQVGHHVECGLLFLIRRDAKLHQEHDFARRGGAEHDVAHQSAIGTQVVEFQTASDGIVAQVVANAVVDVAHQVALVDVENLVECSRNVETERVHLREYFAAFHLFEREPLLIGETELQFIAILACFLRAQDGSALRQLDFADTRQVVHHLLLLVVQLRLIGENLPLASTANAIVWAESLRAFGRILVNMHGFGLSITVFFATNLQIRHITGHHVGNKDGEAVDLGQGLAFGGNIGDENFFEQGKWFLLASHSLFNFRRKSTILQRLNQATLQKVGFLRLYLAPVAPRAEKHQAPPIVTCGSFERRRRQR